MTQERAHETAERLVLEFIKDEANPYHGKWDGLTDLIAEQIIKTYGDGIVEQKRLDKAIVSQHPSQHQCAMQDTCAEQMVEAINRSPDEHP